MKKIFCFTLIFSIILNVFYITGVMADDASIGVVVNGKQLVFDQEPVISNNRVLVPLRKICDAIGAEVYYEDYYNYATISIIKDSQIALLCNAILFEQSARPDVWQISKCTLLNAENCYYCTSINCRKEREILDAQPTIINGRILVPIRIISEYLGGNVEWNGNTKTVTINIPVSTPRSEAEVAQINSFDWDKACDMYSQLTGIERDYTGLYIGEEVYDKKGKAYIFTNPNVDNEFICIYHDGSIEYVKDDDIVFVGDTDKYTKYCRSYSSKNGRWIMELNITDVAKNRILFDFYLITRALPTEATAGWGYFTGENTAEAFGTYKTWVGEEWESTSAIKYYFKFGDDYIDFKYGFRDEFQDDWIREDLSDGGYIRFKI